MNEPNKAIVKDRSSVVHDNISLLYDIIDEQAKKIETLKERLSFVMLPRAEQSTPIDSPSELEQENVCQIASLIRVARYKIDAINREIDSIISGLEI